MAENDDIETGGILEGSGSGGGSERVEEHRPAQERGGCKFWLYVVIGLIIVLAAFPILRLFGVVAETPVFVWVYTVVLIIALLIIVPSVYGMIKKST